MYLLVSYDIADNALRLKLSKKLVYYGLERIQYSVFIGNIKSRFQKQLENDARELIEKSKKTTDKVLILPLEKQLLSRLSLFGQDDKIIFNMLNEKNTLII